MPKVSVIIPAYNCERFVSVAIDSVLAQSYDDYEIIVVNDGSTDSTCKILSGYSSKIKVIDQPNGGPAEARNTGVKHSGGEYLAFLDQDDAWLPDKLKMQVELLEKNAETALAYTDTYVLSDKAFESECSMSLRTFRMRRPRRGRVLEYLLIENFIPTSSVMVRKKSILRAGTFDPSVVPSEDYDMWLRIAAEHEIDYLDVPLVKYRDHVACFRKNKVVTMTHIIDVFNNTISRHPVLKDQLGHKADLKLSQYRIMLGKAYLSDMKIHQALQNFNAACRLSRSPLTPFSIIAWSFSEGFIDILRGIGSKVFQKVD